MADVQVKIEAVNDVEPGAKAALASIDKFNREANQRTMNRAGMGGNFNARIGQLSMQAQDVAVQLQAGANAATVIAQQGSQIASIFGPGGMVLGGLLAIGAAIWNFARGTGKSKEEAEKLVAELAKLRDAVAQNKAAGGKQAEDLEKQAQMAKAAAGGGPTETTRETQRHEEVMRNMRARHEEAKRLDDELRKKEGRPAESRREAIARENSEQKEREDAERLHRDNLTNIANKEGEATAKAEKESNANREAEAKRHADEITKTNAEALKKQQEQDEEYDKSWAAAQKHMKEMDDEVAWAKKVGEAVGKAKADAEQDAREQHQEAMDNQVHNDKVREAKRQAAQARPIMDRTAQLMKSQDQRIAEREAGQREARMERRAINEAVTRRDMEHRRDGLGLTEEQKEALKNSLGASVVAAKATGEWEKDVFLIHQIMRRLEAKSLFR